jgi:hypothetical protein
MINETKATTNELSRNRVSLSCVCVNNPEMTFMLLLDLAELLFFIVERVVSSEYPCHVASMNL